MLQIVFNDIWFCDKEKDSHIIINTSHCLVLACTFMFSTALYYFPDIFLLYSNLPNMCDTPPLCLVFFPVRLRSDRLSLIDECIAHCSTAYKQSTTLLNLASLLRVAGTSRCTRTVTHDKSFSDTAYLITSLLALLSLLLHHVKNVFEVNSSEPDYSLLRWQVHDKAHEIK